MLCEVCEAEEAAFTIIPTGSDGFPQSLGPACFARSGLDFAKAILPPEEIANILGPMFVTPARQAALGKAPKSKQAPEPPPNEEPKAEPGPTEGPTQESATGTDDRD